jgi:hypothetical protein
VAFAYAAPQSLTLAQLEQLINAINNINSSTTSNSNNIDNVNSNANRFLPPQPLNIAATNNNAGTDTNSANSAAALSNLQLDEELGIVDTNNFNPNQNIPNALYTYDYQSLFGSFRKK